MRMKIELKTGSRNNLEAGRIWKAWEREHLTLGGPKPGIYTKGGCTRLAIAGHLGQGTVQAQVGQVSVATL